MFDIIFKDIIIFEFNSWMHPFLPIRLLQYPERSTKLSNIQLCTYFLTEGTFVKSSVIKYSHHVILSLKFLLNILQTILIDAILP